MPSIFRYTAGAALLSSATASVIGAIPSQTVGGFGQPFFVEPTPAPEYELVKVKLAKKDVTNICTEWTIPGGFGQPECANSETCLFTSAGGYWYEGCGETSIRYNWITACYNWPKASTLSAPVSNTYCPSASPYCGFYAFVFAEDYTAYNFGCSDLPYSLYVDLLPTTTDGSTSTDIVLNGGNGSSITESAATTNLILSQSSTTSQTTTASVFVAPGASLGSSTAASASSTSTSTSVPNIGSHSSSSTPTGAIVGGVVGGIAVIGFLAFLIWFFLRKRRQDKASAQAHEAQIQADQAAAASSTAYNNNNRISEIAGTMKPPAPPANTYVPPPGIAGVYGEKPAANANTQEVYRPPGQEQNNGAYAENVQPHSPPPVYAHPTSPPSHYNELDHQNAAIARPTSVPPVSPMATGTSQGVSPVGTPTPQQQYQHMSMVSNATELSGNHNMPPQQQSYSPRPGFQEMSSSNAAVPMRPAGPPPGVQEMHANPHAAVPMRPAGPPPGMQEMSGNSQAASGGVNRPAGPPPGVQRFDMNGNPMTEYHGAELE
ncbi:uncharacterized protein LY89DRAFT_681709 [Mollisia scopiformis]|uniref:Uncharacterized protein n=1 Tax=Mollisia scopiformis TaxID=149040 RepID=A0A194XLY2_MOLSC|nr:uncharacterized protein LY89DRAFT_681709 [Mollisia scopiformis]KUJ21094.1 hypothetical protein LY89DRAFT_681709 [Mollisia scopiformis]